MLKSTKSLIPVLVGLFAILLVTATCEAMDYLWHHYIHHHAKAFLEVSPK